MDDLDFTSLLCSRLCHDLVSPVGAINNGIEILADEDSPEMREQVMDLLTQSAVLTSNKLKFFRIAFGAAGGFGSELDTAESKGALESLFENSRVDLVWKVTEGYASKIGVKLLLNMALIMGEAIIGAGTLTASIEEDGDDLVLFAEASGARINLSENAEKAMLGQMDGEKIEARLAPALLIGKLCKEANATSKMISEGPEKRGICVRFSKDG